MANGTVNLSTRFMHPFMAWPFAPLAAFTGASMPSSTEDRSPMPSRSTVVQFGKFLTVGTLNTAIDFGTLNLLSWLTDIYGGLRLAPINVPGMLLALANSYLLKKHWTFQTRAPAP
jgi:hypothetical protein